jgi:hypothetical protein
MLSNSSRHRLITLAKKAISNRHNHNIEKGVASKFIKFAESWGVKFSTYSKDSMQYIYNRQVDAHAIGKGPMAFGFFEFEGFWCYITEVATVLAYKFYASHADDVCGKVGARLSHAVRHLCKVLEKKMDFSFHDSHLYNIGEIRGRLVCIDFGDE